MTTKDKQFQLTIVTLDRELFRDAAYQVSIPTPLGDITVLPNHEALITAVTPGEIRIIVEKGKGILSDDEVHIATGGGFVEIANNKVHVLSDSAERVDEIDEKRALEAKEKAEQRLLEIQKQGHAAEEVAMADASAALARSIARLKVVKRKKRR